MIMVWNTIIQETDKVGFMRELYGNITIVRSLSRATHD